MAPFESLEDKCERLQTRNAELEAELDHAIDTLDPDMYRNEIVSLRERLLRAKEAGK